MVNAERTPNDYRAEKTRQGLEYQDFIQRQLMKEGWFVSNHSSRKYQLKYGENYQGFEIKNDQKMHETGNIYFETHEKATDRPGKLVESGILRKDHCIYIIGDDREAFIFDSNRLRNIYNQRDAFKRQNPGHFELKPTKPEGFKYYTANGFILSKSIIIEQDLHIKHLKFVIDLKNPIPRQSMA